MHNLPDLQKKMLSAMLSEASGILVTKVGDDVVLVRAGEQRWYGKQAVNAVMTLMVQGYLTRVGNRFELTEIGLRSARRLEGPARKSAVPEPAKRIPTCPRCQKTLRAGLARCGFCGARVPAAVAAAATPARGAERSAE